MVTGGCHEDCMGVVMVIVVMAAIMLSWLLLH